MGITLRAKILFVVTTIVLILCGIWLYLLSSGGAAQLLDLFKSYGITPPRVLMLLFASLDYWWAILISISAFSYFPLFVFNGKNNTCPFSYR